MKVIFKISIILFYIIGNTYSNVTFAQKTEKVPIKSNNSIYVYDFEKLFTFEEKEILSKIIVKYKNHTGNEIIIATTHSIGDFSNIQEYASNLGKIYSNEIKKENIVTIVISKKIKEIAVATSPAAREKLTDKVNKDIIDNIIIKRIKKGCFFDGIKEGLCKITKILIEK